MDERHSTQDKTEGARKALVCWARYKGNQGDKAPAAPSLLSRPEAIRRWSSSRCSDERCGAVSTAPFFAFLTVRKRLFSGQSITTGDRI
jgi:hypothetical protein